MDKDENVKRSDEIKDFNDLIKEVRNSKDFDKERLEKWKAEFDTFWKNGTEGKSWEKLISLLPFPKDKNGTFNPFKDEILLKDEDISLSAIVFLIDIAGEKIFRYSWTFEFDDKTFQFYCGCINLINFVVNNSTESKDLSIDNLKNDFAIRFYHYPMLTLSIAIKYPEIFEKKEASFLCLNKITLFLEHKAENSI